jgi:hypothetical protein
MLIVFTMQSRHIWPDKFGHTVEFCGRYDTLDDFYRMKRHEQERLRLDLPIRIIKIMEDK